MFNKLFQKETVTKIDIYAYVQGNVITLENVPDPVFSEKMMGDGIAIQPQNGMIYAPCDAEVVLVADTKHAIGLKMFNGIELLLHLGLNTVKLEGKGIKAFCKVGDKISVHQKIAEIDMELIQHTNINMISMLIFTELHDFRLSFVNRAETTCENTIIQLEK